MAQFLRAKLCDTIVFSSNFLCFDKVSFNVVRGKTLLLSRVPLRYCRSYDLAILSLIPTSRVPLAPSSVVPLVLLHSRVKKKNPKSRSFFAQHATSFRCRVYFPRESGKTCFSSYFSATFFFWVVSLQSHTHTDTRTKTLEIKNRCCCFILGKVERKSRHTHGNFPFFLRCLVLWPSEFPFYFLRRFSFVEHTLISPSRIFFFETAY